MNKVIIDLRHPVLNQLIDDVEKLCGLGDFERGRALRESLNRAIKNLEWLKPEFRVPSENSYSKYLIYADRDERFCIVSLVWDLNQRSPVHSHYAWCAYGVAKGALAETLYSFDPNTKSAIKTKSVLRDEGYTSYAPKGVTYIHQLGNDIPTLALSIHIYGMGEKQIYTGINQIFS